LHFRLALAGAQVRRLCFSSQQFQSFAGGSKAVDVVALVADVLLADRSQGLPPGAAGARPIRAWRPKWLTRFDRRWPGWLWLGFGPTTLMSEKQFAELAMQRQTDFAWRCTLSKRASLRACFQQVADPLSLKMELKTAVARRRSPLIAG
jgi:hypothetical protein